MYYSVNSFIRHVLLVIFMFSSASIYAGLKPSVPETIDGASNFSAEQVIELILSNSDLVVIDSRKKTEYIKGHIEGAINIINTHMTEMRLSEIVDNKSTPRFFTAMDNAVCKVLMR